MSSRLPICTPDANLPCPAVYIPLELNLEMRERWRVVMREGRVVVRSAFSDVFTQHTNSLSLSLSLSRTHTHTHTHTPGHAGGVGGGEVVERLVFVDDVPHEGEKLREPAPSVFILLYQ